MFSFLSSAWSAFRAWFTPARVHEIGDVVDEVATGASAVVPMVLPAATPAAIAAAAAAHAVVMAAERSSDVVNANTTPSVAVVTGVKDAVVPAVQAVKDAVQAVKGR